MVVELKPPVDQDKGMVISEGVLNAGCAWYFGDDMSDIKAFDALRAREAVDPGFFGMCVAVANPETGAEVSSAADLTLESPEAVAGFLADAPARLPPLTSRRPPGPGPITSAELVRRIVAPPGQPHRDPRRVPQHPVGDARAADTGAPSPRR